ncbi:superfamily I DNA and RNA helicase and helicase subunits-like protein [Emticicia oligotrophica DSM 17448]|uniref:Superfamily I DNA and RNA helicase and helicase subunits-like protein n=1 Tax=Emticicia oligotrophica (strain DSM 17448 / CIP 109782 / MTCC 6937 / GPTSA100-15) TaxID=929562 RepID=A0ABN4ANG4_EMTOG|nr:AAA domain-containing protein [Emticicia oligotrophica]AFK03689.1 superfamily I DNA and RNA helicase and helicase subunits-like protein [Emticicia oligotrophica DSM 17448]
MQKLLKTYLRRLTNLTSRNRSLLLLSLPQEQFIDLHQLDFLDNKPSFEFINQLIAQKTQIPLCDLMDSRMEKVNETSKILRKIARTEAFIEQERGSEDLYVGYPFIKGKLTDGTVVRCPLLFFPVSLSNNGKKWILEKRDENISFNRSFLLAYSHFNQVKINDEFLETSFDDFSKESLVFRTQLYELLKESPIEINFNQDNFSEQLTDFQKTTKADLEQLELNGELKLFPQAVLGIFPQAGSYLVPDYEQLLTTPIPNEETFFISTDEKNATNPSLSLAEEFKFLPFSVDASQEAAISRVKAGQSLVVQGPPGTGKSQLIANLIADFTSRGKKVLVVCQKRVALDTVFQRLQKADLTDFVALIHDFKNDRKALFEKITNQIEQVDNYQKKNKSLDAIFLERNFAHTSRRIDKLSEELQNFKNALFDESICGISVKELYLTSKTTNPYIDLAQKYKVFHFNELADFESRLKRCFQYENKLQSSKDYDFWASRVSFANFTFTDIPKIKNAIDEVVDFQAKNFSSYSVLELNQFDENIVKQFSELFISQEVIHIFEVIKKEKKPLSNRQFDLNKINYELSELAKNHWIETFLPYELLFAKKIQVEQAFAASKSGLSWFSWKMFSKDKREVEALLYQNRLSLQSHDLEVLIQKINNRIAFENIREKLAKKTIDIDPKDDFASINEHLEDYILADKAYALYTTHEYLQTDTFSLEFYQKLIGLIIETKQKLPQWRVFLNDIQLSQLQAGFRPDLNNFQLFDYLQEADSLKNSFGHTELEIIEQLKPFAETANEVFQNSLRLAWMEHIEKLYPILRSVSSLKMEQMEVELQEAVIQKQALSQEIVLLKLREQTYKDLIINRLQNVVSYRELLHQTTKKRKLWSVRKLLENYSDELFKLIPCWMASPESVSAMFELKEGLFDLVIFDEASQCFAEYGIPAIFRGKQVVIAGDSKQLQPNDLYQIRYEEDLSDEPILEIDSLLDLASQYLPQVLLMGHYRSKSLDLIGFSNQHFYKNTLNLLPHYQEINKKEPAIQFVKVNGIWEKNTNEQEAIKVVELIKNFQQTTVTKSIGVVTFNHRQADLIDTIAWKNQVDMHQVLVKNIENIQGDEFDIVIFSVGYAPDTSGRLLMNFGSLNQIGGENRLNVAVTRARENIYVISSILPAQLNVENAQNEGPKLLKKYLSYALAISNGEFLHQSILPNKFRLDWFLKEQLKKRNNQYISELPFADLTVKKENGTYESLILTDDDLYFEGISPKESHAYLPINLQAKGWKFERLWSRNFVEK